MNFTNEIPHNKANRGTNVEANNYFKKILRRILTNLGTNIVDPGFKITPQLVLTCVVSHILIVSYLIMLVTDVPINEKLEATCLMGGIVQGIHKLYAAIFNPDQFCDIFIVLRILHAKHQNDPVIAPVLKKIIVYSTILFECFFIAFYCVALSYALLPIILWKRYGVLTTIFPIRLPLLDWQSPTGYIINNVYHLFFISVGISGLMSADVIFLYFVIHSIGYLEIFNSRVNKLNEMLESKPQDFPAIQEQLFECIQAHQDYMSYIKMVDSAYSRLCMSQLLTSQLCLTFSLLLTIWRKWIVGPFIALCSFFQLLQYCILGTVVTVQNDKASDIIYGMSWYLLPVHLQKLVVLMIQRGQSPAELRVGSFAKLNVATCMKILKTTYTYEMMMLEFLS